MPQTKTRPGTRAATPAAAVPAPKPKKLTPPVEGGYATAPCGCYGLVITIYSTAKAAAIKTQVPCGACPNTIDVIERYPVETVDGQ